MVYPVQCCQKYGLFWPLFMILLCFRVGFYEKEKVLFKMFVCNSMFCKEIWEMQKTTQYSLSLKLGFLAYMMVPKAVTLLHLHYERTRFLCSTKTWNWSGLWRHLCINSMIIWHTSKCLRRLSETWIIKSVCVCMKKVTLSPNCSGIDFLLTLLHI